MKTSQNLNKVLSKLPKTELKVEKVELNAKDDIEKLMTSFDKEYTKLDNVLDSYYKKIFALQNEFDPITKAYTNFNNTTEDLIKNSDIFAKAAKELGVQPSELPIYQNAEAAINRSKNMIAEFFEGNAINKKIKGLL